VIELLISNMFPAPLHGLWHGVCKQVSVPSAKIARGSFQ
jgi:hypothetical protein